MNKMMKVFCAMLLMGCLCSLFSVCSFVKEQIKEYADDKEPCVLNHGDVTQFTYKGDSYTILDDTMKNENLGEWIGYIRQLVAVDDTGAIIVQENIGDATFHSLSDLAEESPDAKYIIPFLNVYADPNNASNLIVDVNGGYHKATLSNQLTGAEIILDFRIAAEKAASNFELNPTNTTQIICDNRVYQVTTETVSKGQLGKYMDILAEKVTFDADTKLPLTKEEMKQIDWTGSSSEQTRESWFYVDVYEISGTNPADAVAVKVNNQYHIARVQ